MNSQHAVWHDVETKELDVLSGADKDRIITLLELDGLGFSFSGGGSQGRNDQDSEGEESGRELHSFGECVNRLVGNSNVECPEDLLQRVEGLYT